MNLLPGSLQLLFELVDDSRDPTTLGVVLGHLLEKIPIGAQGFRGFSFAPVGRGTKSRHSPRVDGKLPYFRDLEPTGNRLVRSHYQQIATRFQENVFFRCVISGNCPCKKRPMSA